MTSAVVSRFEPVHVDISSDKLPAVTLDAIDLAPDGSQPRATAAYTCQLVGAGILTVPGGLRTIFRRNLAVEAALCPIVRRNLAVVNGSYAAVRGVSRTVPCGSVEITGRVVPGFGLSVAQPGRNVAIPCSQPRLAAAHRRQLVDPGILTVLRSLGAIFGGNLAVIDRSHAGVRSLGAPRVGPCAFVGRALTGARRAVTCGSVAITGRVVAGFGFSVAQPGRNVTVSRSQPSLTTARCSQLVSLGVLAVLRRPGAIVCRDLAVVDCSFAAVRGISAPRVGPRAFVGRAPAIARRAIPCGAVELTCCIVARFGVSVTLLGSEVTRPRGQARNFAILRGLCAIFSCKSAVVDGLRPIIRSLGAPRGGLCTFVCCAQAILIRAIPCGAVEITRRIVSSFGLLVTQPGRDITVLSSKPRLATPDACQLVAPGIFAVLGGLGTICGRHLAVVDGLCAVVRGSSAPRGGLVAFVCSLLTVRRRAIACGSVKIARRVISSFGLSVTQPGRGVTVLCSQAGLATAHSGQLVGPGIFAVLRRLGAIFGRDLAIVDGLGAVVRSLGVSRGSAGAFV